MLDCTHIRCLLRACFFLAYAHSANATRLNAGDLLVADRERGSILAIDPRSGEQWTLSGGGVGSGPVLDVPREIVVTQDWRVFVFGAAEGNTVVEIDPRTGDRWAVVGPAAETSHPISGISASPDGTLVTTDRTYDRLRTIDIDTGHSRLFGPRLSSDGRPVDLLAMNDGSVIVSTVTPSTLEKLDSIAASSQDLFSVLADGSYVGPGLTLRSASSIAAGAEGLLYSSSLGDALYSILEFDLETGERRLVTGSNRLVFDGWENPYERGKGPPLTSTSEIVVGLDSFIYATTSNGVLRIDTQTGDRETIIDRDGLSGLAVVPIPEPASIALLISAITIVNSSRLGVSRHVVGDAKKRLTCRVGRAERPRSRSRSGR